MQMDKSLAKGMEPSHRNAFTTERKYSKVNAHEKKLTRTIKDLEKTVESLKSLLVEKDEVIRSISRESSASYISVRGVGSASTLRREATDLKFVEQDRALEMQNLRQEDAKLTQSDAVSINLNTEPPKINFTTPSGGNYEDEANDQVEAENISTTGGEELDDNKDSLKKGKTKKVEHYKKLMKKEKEEKQHWQKLVYKWKSKTEEWLKKLETSKDTQTKEVLLVTGNLLATNTQEPESESDFLFLDKRMQTYLEEQFKTQKETQSREHQNKELLDSLAKMEESIKIVQNEKEKLTQEIASHESKSKELLERLSTFQERVAHQEEINSLRKKMSKTFKKDIRRLKVENQYLRKTFDVLHKNLIGGKETPLKELKPPSNVTGDQSILDVEASIKEVTQKFHEMEMDAENAAKERDCLFLTLECLLKHVRYISEGRTEGDISSTLHQIKSSIKKESLANQGLKHAKEISSIQAEWKRKIEEINSENKHLEYLLYALGEILTGEEDKDSHLSKSSVTLANELNGDERAIKILTHFKKKESLRMDHGKKTEQIEDLTKQLQKMQDDNTKITKEADVLRTRLAELAGTLLILKNPYISDLSDRSRLTKISEKYSELYNNQWTDAFTNLWKKDPRISEDKIIGYLYEMLVRRPNEEISKIFATNLNDVAKLISNETSANIAKALVEDKRTKDKYGVMIKMCDQYIDECVQLCWLMQVQTPPLYLDLKTIQGQAFDQTCYKEYTKKGKKISFVVWPALFLHENGPMLCKGVAQGQ